MKNYLLMLSLIVSVTVLFAGCSTENYYEKPSSSEVTLGHQEVTSYDFTGDAIAEGKLVYNFSNARVIDKQADVPQTGAFETHDTFVGFGKGETETVYTYPDFVTETGNFIDGVYLITIDVTVNNIGARQYTSKDLNDFGDPRGKYDDPYVFEVWTFLVDPTRHMETGGGYWARNIDYYSRMDEIEEHRLAFRLMPGESIDFTIGFFVSDKSINDGWYNISKLCVSPETGSPDAVLVPLNLDVSEG